MDVFLIEQNSWLESCKNTSFSDNILETELKNYDGNWKYNKIEIHPLLLNKNLINENGCFKYCLSKEEDDTIMEHFFPIYNSISIPFIKIDKCVMLSVNIEKYNKIRRETLSILNKYKLPPIFVRFGYTPETQKQSPFYDFMSNNTRSEITVAMLEIFDNFVKESKGNEWLLYLEDDVRVVNINDGEDLSILYNVPMDAELIRPYIGKNNHCDNMKTMKYKISYGGGYNHAFYISVSGCKKVLDYAKKHHWRYICDIDIYKLAKYCGRYPTGCDGWTLNGCNNNNNITELLQEDEKICMYSLEYCIFNQTSLPCI
jgi:hypothetical protein